MTPAIRIAEEAGVQFELHEYTHDPDEASYGAEAANKLGVSPEMVFKTLVVADDGNKLAVAIVPVLQSLNLKAMAAAIGSKKVQMAELRQVERSTGYVAGGVSPLGQKRRLPTVIDSSASTVATIYVSAGRRGLEIALAPADLRELTDASYAAIAR